MRYPRIRDGLAWAVALLLVSAASAALRGQQPDSTRRGPIRNPAGVLIPADSPDADAARQAPLELNAGCQVSRAAMLAVGSYMGSTVGFLTTLPLLSSGRAPSRGVVIGAEVVGAVAGVVTYADVPLAHRLPFCPKAMRTVSGRSSLGAASCRAARVMSGMLGLSSGSLLAFVVNLPGALGDGLKGHPAAHRKTRAMVSVTLPVAGAVAGVLMAGERPVCRARRPAR